MGEIFIDNFGMFLFNLRKRINLIRDNLEKNWYSRFLRDYNDFTFFDFRSPSILHCKLRIREFIVPFSITPQFHRYLPFPKTVYFSWVPRSLPRISGRYWPFFCNSVGISGRFPSKWPYRNCKTLFVVVRNFSEILLVWGVLFIFVA